ncbi:hypothetical protein UPYG_G00183140 [Umbra pygmaea]|uniref:BK channel n=1 Tax=Umbra pygmaea TaxID=75934 RepID=A0ABD0WR15_UMBPY
MATNSCIYQGQKLWWAFLLSSLCLFLGGLLSMFLWKVIHTGINSFGHFRHRRQRCTRRQSIIVTPVFRLSKALKKWAFSMTSTQYLPGKVLMVLIFCVNIGSILTYIILSAGPVEYCMKEYSPAFLVDLSFNICHLLYFGLRFMAAQNKLTFWVDLRSLVDFFTIPPSFVSLFYRRSWLGLRFIRGLHVLDLTDVLQILNVFNSNRSTLKLTYLVAILTGTLLTSAGLAHLLENASDPWLDSSDLQSLQYFECVYFLVVTMSTVGFGDMAMKTTFGRIFVVIFILIGMGLFTTYIPEVVSIIKNRKRFDGSVTAVPGQTYVVVCGHITLSSASAFMKDFLHENRGEVEAKVFFLGNFCPDPELEAFFLRSSLKVTFYQGSVMERRDLDRVMMHKVAACLILCDRFTLDQQKEDNINLMRVISIKKYCPTTRIIVQMLKHNSKAFLQNMPTWSWRHGDAVICLSELKLSFMSQSCRVPGLSTLLANLFTMQSKVRNQSQTLYRKGLYSGIYTEYLSPCFTEMSFSQASKLCFLKLKLLLIGIEYQSEDQELSVLVNPPTHIKLKLGTRGFLIASNASDARRASMYCSVCHSDMKDLSKMKPCMCSELKEVMSHTSQSLGLNSPSLGVPPFSPEGEALWQRECVWEQQVAHTEEVRLDSTGLFHWCPPVPLQAVSLTRQSASALELKDHVLVCLFGDQGSSLLGLGDFMMPLRASSLTTPELRTVVFLGDPQYFSREWPSIHYFPNIYFLPGYPLCGADLRALTVERCCMAVVLSSLPSSSDIMQDNETILCCVTLQRLRFRPVAALRSIHSLTHGLPHNPNRRQPALQQEINHGCGPSQENLSHIPVLNKKQEITTADSAGPTFPLLVELVHSSNVCLVNDMDGQGEFFSLTLSQAFSSGSVFSVDLLDSLMAATYFNPNVPGLICALVTGGDTPLLEAQLSEDNHLRGGEMSQKMWALRQRSKLAQLALQDKPLNSLSCRNFKDLFCQSLDSLEIFCFGLYRLLDAPNPTMERFVITNPAAELVLLPSDRVFCSIPFHQSHLLI